MIKTKFHDIFQTRCPIIQVGMGPYDTTTLAAAVVKAGGIGLISTVGMGFLRNSRALKLVDATLRGVPDLYKGNPCGSTQEILNLEIDGLNNLFQGKIDETPVLGGTVAGRIHSIPTVQELCNQIKKEAEATIRDLQPLTV